MKDIKTRINELLNDVNKEVGTKFLASVLEQHLLSGMTENEQKQYASFRDTIKKLKNEIKDKCKTEELLIEKIKSARMLKENKFLDENEKSLSKNFLIFLERGQLIIDTAINNRLNIQNQQLKIYVISNFYRTICELSLKLFSNHLLIIIDYLINQNVSNKDEIKWLEHRKSLILSNSSGLDDFRSILSKFDKFLFNKLKLTDLINEIFLYQEGGGFKLRNDIAHEKVLFAEYDVKKIILELKKVHRFNTAFIITFFFEEIGEVMNSQDFNPANEYFRTIFQSPS